MPSLTTEHTHASESRNETAGVGWLRHQSNTGGLERAEGNIGEELGGGRRCEVDGGAVVRCGLVAKVVDGLLLEELVTTELESTLEEVTGESWASTSQKSASTLLCDDLAETTNQSAVVGCWVKLDTGLDAVGSYR